MYAWGSVWSISFSLSVFSKNSFAQSSIQCLDVPFVIKTLNPNKHLRITRSNRALFATPRMEHVLPVTAWCASSLSVMIVGIRVDLVRQRIITHVLCPIGNAKSHLSDMCIVEEQKSVGLFQSPLARHAGPQHLIDVKNTHKFGVVLVKDSLAIHVMNHVRPLSMSLCK